MLGCSEHFLQMQHQQMIELQSWPPHQEPSVSVVLSLCQLMNDFHFVAGARQLA